jgi:hypothetical protein
MLMQNQSKEQCVISLNIGIKWSLMMTLLLIGMHERKDWVDELVEQLIDQLNSFMMSSLDNAGESVLEVTKSWCKV